MAKLDYKKAIEAGYSPEEIRAFADSAEVTLVNEPPSQRAQAGLGGILREAPGQFARSLPASFSPGFGLNPVAARLLAEQVGDVGRAELGDVGAAERVGGSEVATGTISSFLPLGRAGSAAVGGATAGGQALAAGDSPVLPALTGAATGFVFPQAASGTGQLAGAVRGTVEKLGLRKAGQLLTDIATSMDEQFGTQFSKGLADRFKKAGLPTPGRLSKAAEAPTKAAERRIAAKAAQKPAAKAAEKVSEAPTKAAAKRLKLKDLEARQSELRQELKKFKLGKMSDEEAKEFAKIQGELRELGKKITKSKSAKTTRQIKKSGTPESELEGKLRESVGKAAA